MNRRVEQRSRFLIAAIHDQRSCAPVELKTRCHDKAIIAQAAK
jgi:hypothetical protein